MYGKEKISTGHVHIFLCNLVTTEGQCLNKLEILKFRLPIAFRNIIFTFQGQCAAVIRSLNVLEKSPSLDFLTKKSREFSPHGVKKQVAHLDTFVNA